uniref:Uncharacterized protein n=1 Tax=Anopheles atroparvus TaxID=41427 RepID=A0A182J584_ANOAO
MRSVAVLLLTVCCLLSHWDFLLAEDNRHGQVAEWTQLDLPVSFPAELVSQAAASVAGGFRDVMFS